MIGCFRKNLVISHEASEELPELLYFLICTVCAAYPAYSKKQAVITSV